MRMMALAAVAVLAGAGAAMYGMRDEIERYVRIVRMDTNPALVGASVTPQGNQAALGMSEAQREQKRV